MIELLDRNVGRILAALQRHSLAGDTVIIFASDHGMYYGERGLSDCWQLNEQPLRVPLIICDPRRAPGGWLPRSWRRTSTWPPPSWSWAACRSRISCRDAV